MKLVRVIKSPLSSKKYRAEFSDGTHTDFGASGYEDYTRHKDKKRRESYRSRHAYDNLGDPKSAGALSYYILWGESTSLDKNIGDFRTRFKV